MSRDASFVTERNRKRMLFAAKVMQDTALANGLTNTVVKEGVPNSVYSYTPHYYNVKEGAFFTSPEELALYQANVAAPSVSTASLFAPGAPTGLTASGIGGTVVVVDFTPPTSDGGSPITNYEYVTDISGGSFVAFSPPVTSGPVTITGLTAGVGYSISLRAVNSVGAGTESDPLSVTTTSSPGAPTLTLSLADNGAAYIYFTAGSGSVTNYEYSTDNGSNFTALSPEDTRSPIKIPSLTNGTTYTVKLRASYYGDVSSASNSLTVTPVASSAPSAYLAYDISNTSSYPGSGTSIFNVGSYSATAVTGTLNGAITYSSSNSGVLDFNGNNSVYITFPSFNFGNTISATAWVYPRFKANINGLLTNTGANVATNGFKFQWNWWLYRRFLYNECQTWLCENI